MAAAVVAASHGLIRLSPASHRRAPAAPRRIRPPPPSATSRAERLEAGSPRPAAAVLDYTVIEPRGVRDFVEQSRDLIRPDGGPSRWFSPLEAGSRADGSPLLLFLPGIDGVGLGLIRHHQRLGKIFDIWCLHIPIMDRTPFEGLVKYVETTVKSEKSFSPNKPIYLVGETLGACLALAVAARNPDLDLILVLANPATSFDKSQLRSLSEFLGIVPEPLHVTIPYLLNFMTGNSQRMSSAYIENELSPQYSLMGALENLSDMLPFLSFLVDLLPKETLLWRLKMLLSASSYANSRLHAVKSQTLILASGRDQLLPSSEEAERLSCILSNCRIRQFKDSGHSIFLEGEIDLVTTIKGACYYRRSRRMDYVSDYLLPTPIEMQKGLEQYRWIDLTTSPVMLSTLEDGKIVKGLAGIPSTGPVVLVGYHMLMGWELGSLVSRFINEKNIHLRGIAHPFIFDLNSEKLMPDSASFDSHRVMGAVPVSAANFYKLLSSKSSVLLYPGGAREALHKKGEQYKLFWPEQSEFVRMACKFGATIIPFGVVGEDDICEVALDIDDLIKVPFYDTLIERINQDAVRLRTGSTGEVGDQTLYLPGLLPKFPGRLYFLFGRPIKTRGRTQEQRNRDEMHQLYIHVKSEVENCIAYLKEKREKDPYRNLLQRLIYHAIRGFDAEVPTFDI